MQERTRVINDYRKLILVTKRKSRLKLQFDKPSVVRQPNAQRIPKPSVLGKPTPFSNSPEMRSFQTNQSVNKTNASDGLFKPVTQQNLPQNRNQAVRNTNVLKPGMYRIASTTTQTRTTQLPHASRNTNPHMSKSSGVIHTTSVSRPQLKCYQVKDKVVPNNSQVKFKKKEVEDHHRISSISKKTKSVTACNDSSNSRTLNVNAVCDGYCANITYSLLTLDAQEHMTGNLKLLCHFVENFLVLFLFGNDNFAPILGYGDLQSRKVHDQNGLYYIEGSISIYFVGQILLCGFRGCFQKSTCFGVRDLRGKDFTNCQLKPGYGIEDFLSNFDYITVIVETFKRLLGLFVLHPRAQSVLEQDTPS
ncbi:hypothetical protein Tco_0348868 [Tanacetum coccineum]